MTTVLNSPPQISQRELPPILAFAWDRRLSRMLRAYVLAGLFFMLLPGTFLGVWNLISISSNRSVAALSPSWIQAHGHAQIFGWLGSFILGIGLYSSGAARRGISYSVGPWICWFLWTGGVLLRWAGNVYQWHWRFLLPLSALMELSAFLLYRKLSPHKPSFHSSSGAPEKPAWMIAVMCGSYGFLAALFMNVLAVTYLAIQGRGPAFPHIFDQRLLSLMTYGFFVPFIWGFSARWVSIFAGLEPAREKFLRYAVLFNTAGVMSALVGLPLIASCFSLIASALATFSLRLFEPVARPAKIKGIHSSFPYFLRISYVWLLVSAILGIVAVLLDHFGGIWGAARHALTVGFAATMVFAIGPRVLPHFAGVKKLFSPAAMGFSLFLLNLGCLLRVAFEIAAYEHLWQPAWRILPISAILELSAVTLFAANLLFTFLLSASLVANSNPEISLSARRF